MICFLQRIVESRHETQFESRINRQIPKYRPVYIFFLSCYDHLSLLKTYFLLKDREIKRRESEEKSNRKEAGGEQEAKVMPCTQLRTFET